MIDSFQIEFGKDQTSFFRGRAAVRELANEGILEWMRKAIDNGLIEFEVGSSWRLDGGMRSIEGDWERSEGDWKRDAKDFK